ncbi:hypothetical protein Plhal304r1_c001g0000861 [Plasmopara halstedii]
MYDVCMYKGTEFLSGNDQILLTVARRWENRQCIVSKVTALEMISQFAVSMCFVGLWYLPVCFCKPCLSVIAPCTQIV